MMILQLSFEIFSFNEHVSNHSLLRFRFEESPKVQVLIPEAILLVLYLRRILQQVRYGPLVLSLLAIHRSLLDLESGMILETEHLAVLLMFYICDAFLALRLQSVLAIEVGTECVDIISYRLLDLIFGLLLLLAEAWGV